jgi:hypothetical protein
VQRRGGFSGRKMTKFAKKRVSIFDEQRRYVVENKESEKRTKPNKADFEALSETQILLPQKMAG